jgi:hypothetical protein
MQEIDNSRSPRDTIRDGFRILARIIAREVVNGRPTKMGGLLSDSPSPGPIHAGLANIKNEPDSNLSRWDQTKNSGGIKSENLDLSR